MSIAPTAPAAAPRNPGIVPPVVAAAADPGTSPTPTAPRNTGYTQPQLPGGEMASGSERATKLLSLAVASLGRANPGSYEVENALGQIVAATPIVDANLRTSTRKERVMESMYVHSLELATMQGRSLAGDRTVSPRPIKDLRYDALAALNLLADPAQLRARPIS